ncbi:hypothetical protein B0T24DRAFT_712176 [Lasiosphaeria ovina]|uniref:Uncharacterized protein n=1 Tax=Lasiosphaeria ovina TaxID=92902 RepID=A0AAE0JV24_9PEZI|nr:hypothetical protein B0T24DRAFT_712176 [Lasiosphaeria ovina]
MTHSTGVFRSPVISPPSSQETLRLIQKGSGGQLLLPRPRYPATLSTTHPERDALQPHSKENVICMAQDPAHEESDVDVLDAVDIITLSDPDGLMVVTPDSVVVSIYPLTERGRRRQWPTRHLRDALRLEDGIGRATGDR